MKADVLPGDRIVLAFNETMAAQTSSPMRITVTDPDGTTAVLTCVTPTRCTRWPLLRIDGQLRAWYSAFELYVQQDPPVRATGSVPGLQYPLRITAIGGFADVGGTPVDLVNSPDVVIEAGSIPG